MTFTDRTFAALQAGYRRAYEVATTTAGAVVDVLKHRHDEH